MADLSPLEIQIVDALFDLSSGYVLDFSNKTFAEFFEYHLRLNIDDPRYSGAGTSKGKRLRNFLLTQPNDRVAKTLSALWEYRLANRRSAFAAPRPDDVVALNELVIRLGGKPIKSPARAAKPAAPAESQIPDSVFAELDSALQALLPLSPQPRGYAFEKFLTQAFTAFGLNPRDGFRNRGEQIDGSFQLDGQTYLLEAKWHGPRIAADELHIFCGKITQKAAWSRGLFVSESGFTQEGLDAFGRSKPVICMDGLDIYEMLKRKLSLQEVLRLKARRAAESGVVFAPVRELFP
ncbi:MAG TPA: restriction endonuclease [Arenimonas sp.]|uniref:restriction endonuclease n=1 Tax=Arenimonas sp. TaxID=1872635 RepID=UPI002D7F4CFD|nr:restriction endonuclease [Arenimonas sp.]HEU0153186.1 restriction endonuclease [Arenimonas sp.]